MTHGWPGSIVEFRKVIEPLADPTAHGGDAADAFHVVCPSLPGFGFSGKPAQTGWGIERIADAWDELMTRLGYARYGAQGGDWGSGVTLALGARHARHLAGIHINMVTAPPDPDTMDDLTEQEQAALAAMKHYQRLGFRLLQGAVHPAADGRLRPGRLAQRACAPGSWRNSGPGPTPTATRRTSDQGRDAGQRDAVLAARHRRVVGAAVLGELRQTAHGTVQVPVGCSVFPKEIVRASTALGRQGVPGLRYWNEPAKGGHFAAFEQPAIFVDEVRAAFRAFRSPRPDDLAPPGN